MSIIKTGEARMVARARLMLLLGEQLITDEIAAVSELVKNAYDADATRVVVTLSNVSDPETGYITVKDNGHGMSLETVLSSWLELGTLSKARGVDRKPRFSESGRRVCLGEKGLGRLAVHKLGHLTELVTKRVDSLETKLELDWTTFESSSGFLEEIPVKWQVTEPSVFTDSNGTLITIRKLRRQWTTAMIRSVQRNVLALKSPFTKLSDFTVSIDVDDRLAPEISVPNMEELVKRATYTFTAKIDKLGRMRYRYSFSRPDLPELNREKTKTKDVRAPEYFSDDRKPSCGSFSLKFFSWDLAAQDKKAVFGDTATYREMIQPNCGIKVFRDGFRVLPYGNPDNDWLSMDSRRVKQFELHLSRNQVIGAIEITAEANRLLLDKTDREGLIDNDAFRDFHNLVIGALSEFETERLLDRRKLKEVTGRTRSDKTDRGLFSQNLAALSETIWKQPKLDTETKLEIRKLVSEAREALDNILIEKEQPLLVAASIGLTYMIPVHEARRSLHESLKILRRVHKSEKEAKDGVGSAISLLKEADEIIGGLGRLMQKSRTEESFRLERPVNSAMTHMRHKLERNHIDCTTDIRSSAKVKGSDRLVTILLLNFIDNSFYWLLRKKPEERRIKIIADSINNKAMLIVSDSGPGFEDDDIDLLTLPFFTRKPNGMGLGLYIANRIAKMNGGELKLLDEGDVPGLLAGGNIAVILQKARR